MNHAERLSLTGRHLLNRRHFLSNSATALGSIALTNLLGLDGLLAADGPVIDPAHPFAPRAPHFAPKAKNVEMIFCAGAVSQLETWDYKPELIRHDGMPLEGGPAVTFRGRRGISRGLSMSFARAGRRGSG